MRKKSQLTVKPLNAWNFSKFKAHKVQEDEYEPTVRLFKNGYPPHQAMFYDNKKSVLACGFIPMGDGQYYAWTLFGNNFKRFHFRFFVIFINYYLNLLEYSSIHHIIRKDMPWTKHMIKMCGFVYVRDEDENMEHWIRMK